MGSRSRAALSRSWVSLSRRALCSRGSEKGAHTTLPSRRRGSNAHREVYHPDRRRQRPAKERKRPVQVRRPRPFAPITPVPQLSVHLSNVHNLDRLRWRRHLRSSSDQGRIREGARSNPWRLHLDYLLLEPCPPIFPRCRRLCILLRRACRNRLDPFDLVHRQRRYRARRRMPHSVQGGRAYGVNGAYRRRRRRRVSMTSWASTRPSDDLYLYL